MCFNLHLSSQAKICGFCRLYSLTFSTTNGVVTFGLLPPIWPGFILPVDLYLQNNVRALMIVPLPTTIINTRMSLAHHWLMMAEGGFPQFDQRIYSRGFQSHLYSTDLIKQTESVERKEEKGKERSLNYNVIMTSSDPMLKWWFFFNDFLLNLGLRLAVSVEWHRPMSHALQCFWFLVKISMLVYFTGVYISDLHCPFSGTQVAPW